MKSIIALLLLAVVAQSAFVEDTSLEAINSADVILEKLNIEVNWEILLRCIKEAHPVLKDLVNLYKIAKAKNYDEAIQIVKKLLDDGNLLIKSCKGAIKRKNVNLTKINLNGLLQCLVSIGVKIPEITQLINLIKKGDIFGVLIKLGQLSKDAKEIVDQCKRYL